MNGIKRRLLAGLSALAIAATSGVPAVFAEGSKDIGKAPETINVQNGYSGDAYRPYAEWRNRPQLGDAVLDGSGNVKKDANGNEVFENMVQSKSVFYAYAKKGEKVYFGQSGHTATDRSIAAVATDKEPTAAELAKVANGGFSGSTIAVTMPAADKKTAYDPSKDGAGVNYAQGSEISGATYGDKRVFLFKPENKKGIITNAVQEQTGPKYGEDADRNLYGYDPFSFVAPEDGTYAFRFLSLDFVGDEKFDPFAAPTAAPTAKPTAAPTAVPTPTPTPEPLDITALPAGTVVVFDTATGEDVGDTIDSTEKYAIITAVKNTDKVASASWSGEAFGQECHKAAHFSGAAFTVAVRPAVAGKLYIVATSSKDITIEARQGSNVSTGNITANTETIISFDVAANEDVYIKSAANGWTLGGMYLSTDGTYPTPTPTSEPTEEPTATPEPTPTPAPTELPYGIYTFTSEDAQDSNDSTADRANGETIRLIKNNYIMENGSSGKTLYVAHAHSATAFDTTSDYAVYIGNSGGSTAAGGLRVIPEQSGILTVAFCGTAANNTVTIEQSGTPTASEAGSTVNYESGATAGTLSANVTAGVPVDIYSTTGSVYIYGLKLDAATYAVRIAGDTTKAETIGADKYTAAEGETVTVTAVPESGYVLTSLTINGAEYISYVQNGQLSFQMPASEAQVSVVFAEVAYAEWILHSTAQYYEQLGNALSKDSALTIMPTLTGSGIGNKNSTTYTGQSYTNIRNSSVTVGNNEVNAVKVGSSNTLTLDSKLSTSGYASYDLELVYYKVGQPGGLIITHGETTVQETDTRETKEIIKELTAKGITEDTVTIAGDNKEMNLLYVGIKYNGGTISGTQSVSGNAALSEAAESDGAVFVNENINGVIASGLAQILSAGPVFASLPSAKSVMGTASLMDAGDVTYGPYDFENNSILPFNNGLIKSNAATDVSNTWTLAAIKNGSQTADAVFSDLSFEASEDDKVTVNYVAYHPYYTYNSQAKISLLNSDDQELISYTYNYKTKKITDVSISGTTVSDFEELFIPCQFSTSKNADGFSGNKFQGEETHSGYNPIFTFTLNGNGAVNLNINRASGLKTDSPAIDINYSGNLGATLKKDVHTMRVTASMLENRDPNADRVYTIDNLSIKLEKGAISSYTITPDTNITGGSIAIVGGLTEAEAGTTINVTATPNTNYTFDHLVVNGIAQAQGATSFTMPGQNTTVSAVFTENQVPVSKTVTVNAVDGNGTIIQTLSTQTADVGSTINYGIPMYLTDNNHRVTYSYSNMGSGRYYPSHVVSDTDAENIISVVYNAYSGAAYFREGETLSGAAGLSLKNGNISNGNAGRGIQNSDKTMFTLPAGIYDVTYAALTNGYNKGGTVRFYEGSSSGTELGAVTVNTITISAVHTSGTGTYTGLICADNTNIVARTEDSNAAVDYVLAVKTSHTASIGAVTNGTVTINGGSTPLELAEGSAVSINAVPNDGYVLDSISVTRNDTGAAVPVESGSFTMPAADVAVTVSFSVNMAADAGAVTVNYVDGNGNVLGSNTPDITGMSIGDTLTYYYPAYVEYNGAYYKANTADSGVFGNTVTLTSSAQPVDVIYVADSTVVGFAEAENMNVSSGNGLVTDSGTQYSMGSARHFFVKGSRDIFAGFSIAEDGSYEFFGPVAPANNNYRMANASLDGVQGVTKTIDGAQTLSLTAYLTAGTYTFRFNNPNYGTQILDYVAVRKLDSSYTVSADQNLTNGSISVSAEQAAEGQNITITAAPASGYELDHIAVNGVDQPKGATSFTMPAENVTVTAEFTLIPMNAAKLNVGENGTAQLSGTYPEISENRFDIEPGTVVSGTYTPDLYFRLGSVTVKTVSGNDVEVTLGEGTFSFTMPSESVNIDVTFEDTRLALVPMSSTRNSNGAINVETIASANGYGESTVLNSPEIVDKEGDHIGAYSRGLITAVNGALSITGPAALNGTDGSSLNGVVEVIPANYGILVLDYTAGDGAEVRMAQTPEFSGTAIMNNTIAVGKNDKNEIRAVVVPNEPVYIYTATGRATINSLKMKLSTDLAGTEWRLNDLAAPLVGAWDITVVGTDGNAKPGRVWTDILFLNAKAHGRSIYPKMNVLTEDSYEYEVDFNGLQPYSFLFYSNNRGFLQNKVGVDGTRVITPLLHSFYSYGEDGGMGKLPTHLEKSGFTSTVIGNYTPYEEGVDHTNKLFLNEVSTDSMQAYNNQSSREIDKGATMSYIVPKYVGYGGNADNEQYSMTAITNGDRDENNDRIVDVNKGTMGLGGKFMFTINEQAGAQRPAENTGDTVTLSPEEINSYIGKSFSLRLDFSGYRLDANNVPVLNPEVDYRDPVTGELMKVQEWQSNGGNPSEKERNNKILLSTLIKGAGTYTLIWDGRDAYGNEVPVTVGTFAGGSVNSYPVHRFTESGIVHLPMVDVERLPWGIKVHRLTTPTPGSGAASTSENEDDTWDLYYNNDGISPSFNNAGAIQSSLINGTFTNSDGKSEINQEVYDFTPDSSWYYTGRSKFPYPSQIGDGVNQSAGISTADGGKMNVLAYDSKDKYNATTYDSGNKGTYRTSTVAKEKYNYISTNEQSYGDRAGLDMWASALSAPVMMHVGVNPNTFTTYSPAIVSFVAEEGTTKIAAPLDQSHVATSDGTRVNYPHHVGRPSTGEYNAAVDANNADALNTFGNTISTAFLSELTSGPTYHAVVGETEAQRYDIDGILWTITIPQQDIEKNYVKLGDGSYARGWEGLNGASVMTDKADFTISNKQVSFGDEHRINKGTIYSMAKDNNGDLQMKIKFRIPEFSVGTGLQRKVSVGLVLDNIYAPNASAIATYVDADNAKVDASTGAKTGETWTQQANFYKTQSGYTEMNSNVEYTDEAGIGYTYEAGKGYVKNGDTSILPNVIPGIVVTMKDMGYVEGRTFDDETKDNNAFFNHRFNTYTGGVYNGNVYTVNDEEAQLFSDEFVVDFWDVVESAESIGDIVGEQSEVNDGSSNEIDMEDPSNGIETIDDILGIN